VWRDPTRRRDGAEPRQRRTQQRRTSTEKQRNSAGPPQRRTQQRRTATEKNATAPDRDREERNSARPRQKERNSAGPRQRRTQHRESRDAHKTHCCLRARAQCQQADTRSGSADTRSGSADPETVQDQAVKPGPEEKHPDTGNRGAWIGRGLTYKERPKMATNWNRSNNFNWICCCCKLVLIPSKLRHFLAAI